MSAITFPAVRQAIEYIRLDSAVAADASRDDSFLLDAAQHRTNSQTAVVYALRVEASELKAVAVRSCVETRVKDAGVSINAAINNWIERLPGLVQGSPAGGAFFERFPEVLQFRLKRLAVLPLRAGELMGLLTLGRAAEESFKSEEIDTAYRVGRLLTAVLERDSLQQKLLERKLVERAKGILQHRRRLSEEQAYLLLRNHSRRRRTPMVDLAREIIENSFPRRSQEPTLAMRSPRS